MKRNNEDKSLSLAFDNQALSGDTRLVSEILKEKTLLTQNVTSMIVEESNQTNSSRNT